MTDLYPAVEGFFVTTLAADLTATASTISLTALPTRITKGYMVIEPSSATKREVIHFTSVGVSSVTSADDTTDATDATGRGCLGSVALGGVTAHDQGVTVIIAAVEQYWARTYAAFTVAHDVAGTLKSGAVLTLPQINDTSSDHQYVFAVSELAADRTVTLPLLAGNDVFVFADFIQTLTNKTLTSPVLNTGVSGTAVLDEDNMASDSATKLATQQSIKAYVDTAVAGVASTPADGWLAATGTWTYASATTITVPSGAAALYRVGDKVKLTQTTAKYFYIVAVADTLLTVTGGSDFTVANAAITSPYYSHQDTPIGFPDWFAYTPTGGNNTTLTGRFQVRGRIVNVKIKMVFSGTPSFSFPTLPITASANMETVDYSVHGVAGYLDAGTANAIGTIFPQVTQSATTILIKLATGANISTSTPITWANGDCIWLWFNYEM